MKLFTMLLFSRFFLVLSKTGLNLNLYALFSYLIKYCILSIYAYVLLFFLSKSNELLYTEMHSYCTQKCIEGL